MPHRNYPNLRPPRSRLAWLALTTLLGCLPLTATASITRSVDSSGVVTLSQTRRAAAARVSAPAAVGSGARQVNVAPEAQSSATGGRFDATIAQAAALYQIPEELIRAVIFVESGFNPRAVSPANAKGLMQLIPATAQRMQVEDTFDPRQNIFGGTRYLRILANLFNGDLTMTVAAYNAGEGAVLRYGGVPPFRETEDYVTRVISLYRKYRAERP